MATTALPKDAHGHIIVSLRLNNGDRDWQTEDPDGWLHPLGRLYHLGGGHFWFVAYGPDAAPCTGWMGTEADLLCRIVRRLKGWLPVTPV
ncbi:hypothetical protein [Methylobacterium sp. WCS2018Hpa-22]|jgi:hypothetical protein|uniref:hypothetical protein n=1 Tax=Methylobacterium sp. WCS2018Hpa-22 TaxID=3073633 RepID=UPI00288A6A66|nr:hypothetical protein [Methylobacterium sp. WCS2018Hpa-22]